MRLKGMRLSGQRPNGMRPNGMRPDGMRLKGRGSRERGLSECGPTEWIHVNSVKLKKKEHYKCVIILFYSQIHCRPYIKKSIFISPASDPRCLPVYLIYNTCSYSTLFMLEKHCRQKSFSLYLGHR